MRGVPPRRCHIGLLLGGWAAATAAAVVQTQVAKPATLPRQRPIARREGVLTPTSIADYGSEEHSMESVEMDARALMKQSPAEAKHFLNASREDRRTSSSASSLVEAAEFSISNASSRSCPGGVTCGERADNLIWDQACWDCMADYQEFYCEKSSLTSPFPTFVDVCAREGQYRGAFCKKFAEMQPPAYYEDCFFPGSEYKQIYCEKLKLRGEFKSVCAADADVGPNYCEGFAVKMKGYIECHAWPGFMMLFCETKQNATIWDGRCANHNEVGANYCEDFAISGDIKAECIKYPSYLTLFCDIKASNNQTVDTCADETAHGGSVAGMYCQELALKKNGFEACFGVAQFDATYCAEITWTQSICELRAGTRQIP